jgi:methyltransferase (TIGR00027 family)
MEFRGIGQSPESPVTGTAAWLSSVCAILSKDATFGPVLRDPYAIHFAQGISDQAPALLAAYDDEATRSTFINERERTLPGSLTVVCYRKPEMERLTREALAATGARQLVVMGAGCDTLALRLARDGLTPKVFEIDRPAVVDYRARVFQGVPLDLAHVREVGVDFDHQTFGEVLIDAGYDPTARAVFFAEGLLGYVQPEAVDEIFRFIKQRSAPGSRFVFSFTENRRAGSINRTATSEALDRQGESPVFDLPPAEAPAFVEAHGFKLLELLTAKDLTADYRTRHDGRIRILPFMHLAVAET